MNLFWYFKNDFFFYFCSSSRIVFNTSSHNFLLLSMKFFNRLYVNVIIFVFQCVFDIRHKGGNKIGRISSRLSSINCTIYSFDHKANERSAIWKCGDVADCAICLNRTEQTRLNTCASIISRISSNSFRNKIFKKNNNERQSIDSNRNRTNFFCWASLRPKFN